MKIVFEIETINFSSVVALWVAQWLLNAHHHHRRRYPRRVRQTKKLHSILKASTRLSISIITQRINISASHSHYSIASCSIAIVCIHFLGLISDFWIVAFALRFWVAGCWSAGVLIPSWQRLLILGSFRQPPRKMNYYENLVNYCAKCAFSRNNCDNDSECIEMLIYKSIYQIWVYLVEFRHSLHLSLFFRFVWGFICEFGMHCSRNEMVVSSAEPPEAADAIKIICSENR